MSLTKVPTGMIFGLTVTSRTAMAAIPVISEGQTVFLFEGGRSGDFVLKAGTIPFTDTLQALFVASSTPGYYWERKGYDRINLLWFGANPVYTPTVDNFAPFQNAIELCGVMGRTLYIPGERFGFTTPIQFLMDSFKTTGLTIEGDGRAKSILDCRSVTAVPNAQLRATTAPKDNFYPSFTGFAIIGDVAGEVFRVGEDDFSDPVNMPVFRDFTVQNFNTTAASRGVRLNYVLGGRFDWQVNCGSGGYLGGEGIAVVCRQVSFCEFFGSMGSAELSMQFQDGFNIGNKISTPDFENVKTCVRFLSGTPNANDFEVGQWSFSENGIDCQVGTRTRVLNPNKAPNAPAVEADFIDGSVGLTVTP
jgi:hypothetical protein